MKVNLYVSYSSTTGLSGTLSSAEDGITLSGSISLSGSNLTVLPVGVTVIELGTAAPAETTDTAQE